MKGIRERRSESRTRKAVASQPTAGPSEPSNNPWAANLELDTADPLMPTNLVMPSSASPGLASPGLARRPALSKSSPRSPRAPISLDGPPRRMTSSSGSDSTGFDTVLTPSGKAASGSASSYTAAVTTPPPWATPRSANFSESGRSGSHMLQNDSVDTLTPAPLTPSRPSTARDAANADDFARAAIERHRAFIEREAAAGTDHERVQLFAEFIVKESRLRSTRYAGAIESMGSQMPDLTKDLFRPYPESEAPGASARPNKNSRPSPRASLNQVVHEAFSAPNQPQPPLTRPESAWWGGYMPSLSPIPSMSASIVPDEMSSRGRAPSRWWEASQTGSIAGGGARGVERSKRESKYMGLPLRDWEDAPSTSHSMAGPSAQTLEYPPEKVGWHEQVTPRSSDPRKLDVSRLVTLPPPYPRHYPAVNNHHPALATLRSVVRGLADMTELNQIKQGFSDQEATIESDAQRQRRLDDLRKMVETGRMSYTEAARVEQREKSKAHEGRNADLELYRTEVLEPLQTLLSHRIATATDAFETLKRQLGEHNPVEEGDEKPELLEKLTLLKWVFEARELLHREEYELSRAGNERYHRTVAASCKDERKLSEMHTFFERSETQRRAQVEKDALARFEHFTDVVEATVEKGVEVQLSTFWDIAPPLVDVIQKVQVEKGVQADVEYDFSQQYLWEVLTHAEKSAYQFIEAQINLLCLLHEVKSGMTKQGAKVMMAERHLAGKGVDEDEDEELADVVKAEEERLTADLKEKVTTVEEQWQEAMGQVVEPLKERIREWLQRHGGWEAVEDD